MKERKWVWRLCYNLQSLDYKVIKPLIWFVNQKCFFFWCQETWTLLEYSLSCQSCAGMLFSWTELMLPTVQLCAWEKMRRHGSQQEIVKRQWPCRIRAMCPEAKRTNRGEWKCIGICTDAHTQPAAMFISAPVMLLKSICLKMINGNNQWECFRGFSTLGYFSGSCWRQSVTSTHSRS